jgi:hypothetical protein
MKIFALSAAILLLPCAALAAINGKCTDIVGSELDTSSGICVTRKTCDKYGGDSSWVGYCPYDGKDVRCCFIESCDNKQGFCDWTSDCSKEGGSTARSMSRSMASPQCACATSTSTVRCGALN